MFCWKTFGSGIHVDVTIKQTAYREAHPFMTTVFPKGSVLFQHDIVCICTSSSEKKTVLIHSGVGKRLTLALFSKNPLE